MKANTVNTQLPTVLARKVIASLVSARLFVRFHSNRPLNLDICCVWVATRHRSWRVSKINVTDQGQGLG